jgi:16S rRNA (cytosine1402-N4)-methyltransferase
MTPMSVFWPHQPVLYHEIIHALQPRRGGFYIDGTVGAGGHAWGILEASGPDGRLLGLDLDTQALSLAHQRLAEFGSRVVLVQASYVTLGEQMEALGWTEVDGIVLDLGISSMQVDTVARGFSFLHDAPLDMRFDQQQAVTAADLVNTLPEKELADILFNYGEERRAYQVARAIVQARPLETTQQLAQVVARSTHSGREGMHPATRTFQALRIAVNRELESVERVLPLAMRALRPGGRLAVIAFHSLEDRLVKQYLRRESQDCVCPPRQPICTCGHKAILNEITRRPLQASEEEIQQNARARSAKLRVAEKL